jgi:uncharacterized membrane protein YtjA (UPF0391 family)
VRSFSVVEFVDEDPRNAAVATNRGGENCMIYYALVFLIVGLVAGALGLAGVAAVASQIAWVLFLIGVVLLVLHLAVGRRTLTP